MGTPHAEGYLNVQEQTWYEACKRFLKPFIIVGATMSAEH